MTAWAAEHRACKSGNTWLAGAPPYPTHLPGGAMTFTPDPAPTYPIALRNLRGLHGALTTVRGERHGRYPAWSIFPYGDGWALYWAHDEDAQRWGGSVANVPLWDRPTALRFGPLVRLRAPVVAKRGRQQVRIDTITPVVMRSCGGERAVTCPGADTLTGTLAGELLYRLSPAHDEAAPKADAWANWMRPRIRVELVSRETEPVYTPMGDKYGTISGWEGSVVVDVNAPTRWLLEACARGVGLGGRSAFGFGRVRVTACP